MGRRGVLMAGLGLLITADLLLALLPGWAGLAFGVTAWGLHLGFSQGIFSAMIADSAPANLRGTAFGLFNLLTGAAPGDLFIVRTAGNYVDDAGFGSLAYAVAELKVPLIVVLGHEKCGAVAAANAVVNDNTQLPPSLLRMVQPILPASIDARARRQPGEDMLDRAVHLNVKRVADSLRATSDPLLAAPLFASLLLALSVSAFAILLTYLAIGITGGCNGSGCGLQELITTTKKRKPYIFCITFYLMDQR